MICVHTQRKKRAHRHAPVERDTAATLQPKLHVDAAHGQPLHAASRAREQGVRGAVGLRGALLTGVATVGDVAA